ncbi:hypothetical protein CRENBAI_007881 [Crenichthys baileyi]|uniref:Uncharacterized protein n=1 Tax=Crenichthys baileyi TaxID=28760 RepID=A0AAV9RUX0_9TELE
MIERVRKERGGGVLRISSSSRLREREQGARRRAAACSPVQHRGLSSCVRAAPRGDTGCFVPPEGKEICGEAEFSPCLPYNSRPQRAAGQGGTANQEEQQNVKIRERGGRRASDNHGSLRKRREITPSVALTERNRCGSVHWRNSQTAGSLARTVFRGWVPERDRSYGDWEAES